MTPYKLPGIRRDLVRTDPEWENWDLSKLSEAIRLWLRRHQSDSNNTEREIIEKRNWRWEHPGTWQGMQSETMRLMWRCPSQINWMPKDKQHRWKEKDSHKKELVFQLCDTQSLRCGMLQQEHVSKLQKTTSHFNLRLQENPHKWNWWEENTDDH